MKFCALKTMLPCAMALCLAACGSDNTLDMRVERTLELAGDNGPQLRLVLDHYSGDSLKLEAARFLIANMPGHLSYADTVAINRYYNSLDTAIAGKKGEWDYIVKRAIMKVRDEQATDRLFATEQDMKLISAEYLIENIDRAFETWRTSPYCRHLGFEDFCEYILPYKSAELQALDDWREQYGDMFADSLELTRYCSLFENSTFRAAETLNNCLIDSIFLTSVNMTRSYLPYRLSTQLSVPYGTCDDFCRTAVSLFRAAGIPVMHDFVPQWGYTSAGHSWFSLKAQTGKDVAFVPFFSSPKEQHKIDETKAKVYRHTYAANEGLIALNATDEFVPPFFRNIFLRDVTAEYVKPHSITVTVDQPDGTHAYLAVSRRLDWNPIAVAMVKDGKAIFENLGDRCVYQPVTYNKEGRPRYISPALFINPDGSVTRLDADRDRTVNATLYRKYTMLEYAWNRAVTIDGCRFEASDDRNFVASRNAGEVKGPPHYAGEVEVLPEVGARRYWRMVKRGKNPEFDIAELTFFDRKTGERIKGTTYLHRDVMNKDERDALMDGDILTATAVKGDGREAWIGVDFGHQVEIGMIQYTPRSDGNSIEPGDIYELLYWNDGRWTTLGQKTATGVSVSYDNIPAGALLLLRDRTKGSEERIFTLASDGTQVFH